MSLNMSSVECLSYVTNTTNILKTPPPSLCHSVQQSSNISEFSLISNEIRQIVEVTFFSIIITVTGVFGMASNVINGVIFHKHGFHDTVNIGLFALAVSDFFTLLTLEWVALCLNPLFYNSGIPWDTKRVPYLTALWPHFCFGRISCWVTTYIKAERCLCIALPMTVKQIITPRRTTIVMCVTYFANFLIAIPTYMGSYLDWTFNAERNATLLSMAYRHNGALLDATGYIFFATTGAIPLPPVIIFTIILVVRLKRQSHWIMTSSNDNKQQEVMSKRESKTMTMLVLVACIRIVCFTSGIVASVAVYITPGFSITGRYANLFYVVWCLVSTFQAFNSSVNIFVYYNMSSKYRKTFRTMILWKRLGGHADVHIAAETTWIAKRLYYF